MNTYDDVANTEISKIFLRYYSIPTFGFTPVSLEHAKYMFECFHATPGPWKSLGRVLKGIYWDVEDSFVQVDSHFDKTTATIHFQNTAENGEFTPALQEPIFGEVMWRGVAQAIVQYMVHVYSMVPKSKLEEFEDIISTSYNKDVKWTGEPMVDYLALLLSRYNDVYPLVGDPETTADQYTFYRTQQVTLNPHYEALKWVYDNIYRKF